MTKVINSNLIIAGAVRNVEPYIDQIFENIDVKRTFGAFNNFGQDFIMAKHIKGISSSSIICNITLDKFLEIDLDKIDIDSKVS